MRAGALLVDVGQLVPVRSARRPQVHQFVQRPHARRTCPATHGSCSRSATALIRGSITRPNAPFVQRFRTLITESMELVHAGIARSISMRPTSFPSASALPAASARLMSPANADPRLRSP